MHFRLKNLIVSLLSLFAVTYIAGCDNSLDKKPENYPDALILLPNATDVKYYKLGGSFQLTYKIETDYPAADLISSICNQLKQGNWYPLKESYLNPGVSASHVTGWSSFEDKREKTPQTVLQWIGDWENKAGDVVTYGLSYKYDTGKNKDIKHLTVTGIFMPAPLAKKTREEALEFHKGYNADKTK
jgi:hypothetical protein